MNTNKISLVIPCYNEQDALPHFYKAIDEISKTMKLQEFEIIFVNDGSKDKTLFVIKEIAKSDIRVKFISFSRNFGKEAGMYAGLQHATGDYIAVMDADMQDPPALLNDMYNILLKGEYDCVATRRTTRKGEPLLRSFFAHCFYKIINKLSSSNIVDGARDFRLMTRQMTDTIISVGEYNRFSKGIFAWVGFETMWLEYVNVERVAGETKWSFWKLLLYSLEGIIAFSTAPLAIASIIGFIFCISAFVLIFAIIIRTLIFGDPVSGWPSLACIVFFMGGLQLFCTGILGEYLAKTYLETKHRPIYIVKEKNCEM